MVSNFLIAVMLALMTFLAMSSIMSSTFGGVAIAIVVGIIGFVLSASIR